jgi:hypothetical protein
VAIATGISTLAQFIGGLITRNFVRPDCPDLIVTADLGHLKCFATKARSSALALPSTGGDFSRANQWPSGICSSNDTRELGFTLICSMIATENTKG